jgi:TonB family protein
MMRKVLVAALALSPMMLHAQANSPAQPQSSTLQAKLGQPNELAAAANSPRAAATPTGIRISTGVVAPKLVHTVDITTNNDMLWQAFPTGRKVVVGMIVDETGKPTDLKIVRSAGAAMDKNVLDAVSQYRFEPGTVSHQAVASPLNLEIEMLAPGR